MKKYTQKEIKDLVRRGLATDISNHRKKEINGLRRTGYTHSMLVSNEWGNYYFSRLKFCYCFF
ncbi:hypothetical protein ERUR111494_09280 [Erysipelothrix urinaevulpis]|uniref:hypothetical protein n=1 Tax=Erysipelothrix urinaevulpis TaxID=2683717 RepID=UPI00135746EB|nr:hypothetical protein [Erysipelothrix urinaevulpis]